MTEPAACPSCGDSGCGLLTDGLTEVATQLSARGFAARRSNADAVVAWLVSIGARSASETRILDNGSPTPRSTLGSACASDRRCSFPPCWTALFPHSVSPHRYRAGCGGAGGRRLVVCFAKSVVFRLDPAAKKTALVALGIGEHVPRDLALPDVHAPGAELEQSLQFGVLVAIGRVHVEVNPILVPFGPSGTTKKSMPHPASADGLIDTPSGRCR